MMTFRTWLIWAYWRDEEINASYEDVCKYTTEVFNTSLLKLIEDSRERYEQYLKEDKVIQSRIDFFEDLEAAQTRKNKLLSDILASDKTVEEKIIALESDEMKEIDLLISWLAFQTEISDLAGGA